MAIMCDSVLTKTLDSLRRIGMKISEELQRWFPLRSQWAVAEADKYFQ
jgi:3'-phosphoadenosine 5'-phosphosulfate synthase